MGPCCKSSSLSTSRTIWSSARAHDGHGDDGGFFRVTLSQQTARAGLAAVLMGADPQSTVNDSLSSIRLRVNAGAREVDDRASHERARFYSRSCSRYYECSWIFHGADSPEDGGQHSRLRTGILDFETSIVARRSSFSDDTQDGIV